MFIKAKLVFDSYLPDVLQPGMWFKQQITDTIYGKRYTYDRLFLLGHTPQDQDAYIAANGCPVMPVIVSITANPDEKAVVLAQPHQIGWWDDDPDVEELRDIELADINIILSDYDNEVYIEVENEAFINDELAIPVLYMDKVTLRLYEEEEYDYDDYEDWDDIDDITDADHETE
jgi:hypothetical protein